MAEELVSAIIKQLVLILQQTEGEIRLIVGVDEEVEKLTSSFQAIQAVLEDAERRQVMDKAVRDWLDKLKDTSYDIDDVLDEWTTIIRKMLFEESENASKPVKKVLFLIRSYCSQFFKRHEIALKIKSLNKTVDDICMEKDKFKFSSMEGTRKLERPMTTSLIDISEVHGRNHENNSVVNFLLSESSQGPNLSVISIVGMGGIGKTTLARLAFNDERVKVHFEVKIWVCVSDPFDEIRIAKAILESLRDDITNSRELELESPRDDTPNLGELVTLLRQIRDALNSCELETLLQQIHRFLKDKRFLLVLDDVWTENPQKWEQLKNALKSDARGSRILVTTRKENTAKIMGTTTTNMILLRELPNEECWLLFRQIALSGRVSEDYSRLEDIGRKVVDKCSGLPLAVKVLGGLLSLKTDREQWQSVLDSELWKVEERESELWESGETQKGIFPPLLFSYYDLPSKLRKCFSYCAIFCKDDKIDKDRLIRLWMAQGYLKIEGREDIELVGKEYFENLATRSFFQEFERSEYDDSIINCKMHDIVHDFAQYLTKNEHFSIDATSDIESSDIESRQLQCFKRRVRHSLVISGGDKELPDFIYDGSKLRSLVMISDLEIGTRIKFSKLFDNLTCLRTLEMFGYYSFDFWYTPSIPKTIKKLKHLRCLKLGGNREVHELPEEVCDLYNLQILDVSSCSLRKLPGGIGKLINLRHLINNSTLLYMPKGLERLTCLRTLSTFVVSDDEYVNKACKLECLKNLIHLQGSLTLARLGDVIDVGDAKNAQLGSMKKIVSLHLNFSTEYRLTIKEYGRFTIERDGKVLEALQPSPDLEELSIEGYFGSILFPRWLMSLTKLRKLTLRECWRCKQLPPFGRLPSLESLQFFSLHSVKKLGNEFLGIEGDDRSVIAFPKLKYLKFYMLWEWQEWDNYKITGEKEIQIMPCLHELDLPDCYKLKVLPDYILQSTTLNRLVIPRFGNLAERYKKDRGEDWPKIAHIPNIQFFG